MRHTENKTSTKCPYCEEECGEFQCKGCPNDSCPGCSCPWCQYEFMRRHRRARRIVAVLLVFAGLMTIVGIAKLAT